LRKKYNSFVFIVYHNVNDLNTHNDPETPIVQTD
jgi:hypothetical protein